MSPRSSGILLHPTSLPSPFGIGDLGAEARTFIDFLVTAGQRLWQILPLGPTGFGDSPYQSFSAFAGNPLLIDPRQLVADQLITEDDITIPESLANDQVDFGFAREFKLGLLQKAFETFKTSPSDQLPHEFSEFYQRTSWWLTDYALFCAFKDVHGGRQWAEWDQALARREPAALEAAGNELLEQILAQQFWQFLFFRQWQALHDYAHSRGVSLVGDMPIFVAHDSVDVWAHPQYFKLDEAGIPRVVAGVPPDYFSETGQLWGNPLYDWERLRADGFKWWIDRVRWSLELCDLVRLDHFRGFVACWEVPASERTAQNGQWVETPGRELFSALRHRLDDLPVIAENLGVITPEVEALRADFGFPGMRVLQFAFGGDAANDHLPHNYERNTVVYTGTHDNDTSVGWFAGLGDKERRYCLSYLNSNGAEIDWAMIRAALSSVADTAIIPVQDLLGLGGEARMNKPASETGNWSWRMSSGALTEGLADRLRDITELYGRGSMKSG